MNIKQIKIKKDNFFIKRNCYRKKKTKINKEKKTKKKEKKEQ